MRKIGLLSDTHGDVDQKILDFFQDCDEIWHAGDIGNYEVVHLLGREKVLRAVSGNIDSWEMKKDYPLLNRFKCEEMSILMIHIGGYPGKFEKKVKEELALEHADIVVCGHSHILKVIYDKKLQLLHLNPGAAGIVGFHSVRTALRFKVEGRDINDLEILELPRFRNQIESQTKI